ncbi:MAG TPA: glycosyltransferase [Gemmatimonadales bacterium]|nr:glycosyltransferase [Gemmatimonadales bacterium]
MIMVGILLIALPVLLLGYSYVGYPLLLMLAGRFRHAPAISATDPPAWPRISIALPAYNEQDSIAGTLEGLLQLDYPPELRQIIVVSDASSDATDDIVRRFESRGVELLRLPARSGKTAAENAVFPRLTGDIIVNTDATIRILPGSLKPLIRAFQDPAIGVASGRDLSVGDLHAEHNRAESGYVGYEMWVRDLETGIGSIVGASGCYYGIRRHIVDGNFPAELSRDFASALLAREQGYRSVSVSDAVCLVPRARDLRTEYRRKVRTMSRGLETLWFKRHLLNPFRYGSFGWMLWSHKLVRWLSFPAMVLLPIGLVVLSSRSNHGVLGELVVAGGLLCGLIGFQWPSGRKMPALFAIPAFTIASAGAAIEAWGQALRGVKSATWEPTRRPQASA